LPELWLPAGEERLTPKDFTGPDLDIPSLESGKLRAGPSRTSAPSSIPNLRRLSDELFVRRGYHELVA
jgi:hypothetical protein